MSLTSSMHHFKQEVSNGSKNRKNSVASMIGSYKSNRMNHKTMDIHTRLQDMKALRDNIHAFLAESHNNRSSMGANTKQSRDDFMNNLRNSTKASLNAHKADRMALAADVLGAKSEWLGTAKKKINPISKEKVTSFASVPFVKTISAELSDEDLAEPQEEIPAELPVEVPAELSGEIPNDGGCPDDLLSENISDSTWIEESPAATPADEVFLPEQPTISESIPETSVEAIIETSTGTGNVNADLEMMVFAFISDAANGKRLGELTEYVRLTDDGCDVQALMINMTGKGMIRKNKGKYYVA